MPSQARVRAPDRVGILAILVFTVVALAAGPVDVLAARKVSKQDVAIAKRSGRLYITQRLYDKAIEQFERAVEGDPSDPEARYFLGYLYSTRGLVDEMCEQLDKCLSLEGGDKYLGGYKTRGDNFPGIQDLRDMWWRRKFNGAIKAMGDSDFPTALEDFQAAKMLVPDRPDTYKGLGICYSNLGQTEAGIEAYIKAIELDSADVAPRINLGIAYMNTGKFEEAVEPLKKATEMEGPDAQKLNALEKLAQVQERVGDREGALETAEKARAIDPDNFKVLEMAGRMYLIGEDFQKAAESLEKVREQQPDNTVAIFNLAEAYKGLGESDKAEALFRKSAEADSTDSDAWFRLGQIQYKQERFDDAIEAFQKVVDLKPSNARAWRMLSSAYAKKSQEVEPGTAEAKECTRQAAKAFSMYESLQSQ